MDTAPNPVDPDWHIQLDPDPAWLDALGANLATFFKVGDILGLGVNPLTDDSDFHVRVATPTLHLEVNGWENDKHQGVAPPSDWTVQAGGLDGVIWPYQPTVSGGSGSTALAAGQYVRVIGSLVTDIPHEHGQGSGFVEFWQHYFGFGAGSGPYDSAAQDWGGNLTEQDQAHPARWTEMHPPDLIVIADTQPAPQPTEAIFGAALVARASVIDPVGPDKEVTVDLHPPAPQPPHTKAAIIEYVGPETRYASITEGNAARNGAAITLYSDRATIHVKVHGDAFAGRAGMFKAIYRMSWVPDPHSFRLKVSMQPAAVPAGTASAVTFVCADADTGAPLAGTVSMNGQALGATNTQLTEAFTAQRVRVWEPGDPKGVGSQRAGHWVWDQADPIVDVDVPNYASATFTVRLA